ncbi:helix-turn-helix transcriptional regulator [Streptomyces sp. NPDC005805]|uniref:helix-turn-helix domain-containing protein n=1 Tax=Streptomyces sp. NPDC005805 TaxID=3157068 RepID=UPI00340F92ED
MHGRDGHGHEKKDHQARDADLVREILDSTRVARGMTMKALAEAMEITPRTLRNWLRDPSGLTGRRIERLADALDISAENRANLRQLLVARPEPAGDPGEPPVLTVYRRLIDGSAHPAMITDHTAENFHINAAFHDLFAPVAPHRFASPLKNGLTYILFHPHAADVLGDGSPESFREYWLMPALAHHLAALRLHPGDARLRWAEREIRNRPRVRRAYEALPEWIVRNGDLHVNSTPRPFRDPRTRRPRTVNIVTEGHHGYQPFTLTHTTWVLDGETEHPGRGQNPGRAEAGTAVTAAGNAAKSAGCQPCCCSAAP